MPAVSRDPAISDTSKISGLRKGVLRQPMRCGEQKVRFYKEKQWVVLCVAEKINNSPKTRWIYSRTCGMLWLPKNKTKEEMKCQTDEDRKATE